MIQFAAGETRNSTAAAMSSTSPLRAVGVRSIAAWSVRAGDPFLLWLDPTPAMRQGMACGGQARDAIGAHRQSLQQFPPRQKGGSLNVEVK